jgi:hypothetical protein
MRDKDSVILENLYVSLYENIYSFDDGLRKVLGNDFNPKDFLQIIVRDGKETWYNQNHEVILQKEPTPLKELFNTFPISKMSHNVGGMRLYDDNGDSFYENSGDKSEQNTSIINRYTSGNELEMEKITKRNSNHIFYKETNLYEKGRKTSYQIEKYNPMWGYTEYVETDNYSYERYVDNEGFIVEMEKENGEVFKMIKYEKAGNDGVDKGVIVYALRKKEDSIYRRFEDEKGNVVKEDRKISNGEINNKSITSPDGTILYNLSESGREEITSFEGEYKTNLIRNSKTGKTIAFEKYKKIQGRWGEEWKTVYKNDEYGETTVEYTESGIMLYRKYTDKNNGVTKIEKWDDMGRGIYTKDYDGSEIFRKYNKSSSSGAPFYRRTIDANGKETITDKDPETMLMQYEKDGPTNTEKKYEYSNNNNKVKITSIKNGKVFSIENYDLNDKKTFGGSRKRNSTFIHDAGTVTYEEFDEHGNRTLSKTKWPDGIEAEENWTWKHVGGTNYPVTHTLFNGKKEFWAYNKNMQQIYHKDYQGKITKRKYDRFGRLLRNVYPDGSEEIYKYNKKGQNIYFKTKEGKEEIKDYWDNGIMKYHKDLSGDVTEWTEDGRTYDRTQIATATKKAEKYNKLYHGLFLHSTGEYALDRLLEIKEEDQYAEICVSTVRSNTVFRSESQHLVLIGFGKIRELYDFDAYSEIGVGGERYATTKIKQTEELHDINKANVKDANGYDEKLHYDEGFMNFNDAEIIFASIPDFWSREKKQDILKKLEKFNRQIKTISAKKFSEIKNTEELMNLTYRVKERQEDERLESDPRYMYDEKKKMTFKDFIMLKESRIQIPLDQAYEIFRKEYEKATGKSWDEQKFMNRAANWEFYGDERGYVAIRRQKSGFVKLVGMAGDNKSKLKGIQDLVSMNVPMWGMVSKEIKDIALRKGMRMPNFLERQVLKKSISPEVFGDAKIIGYLKDGGVKIQYPDVGTVVKYLVGTPVYYSDLKKRFGNKIKDFVQSGSIQ